MNNNFIELRNLNLKYTNANGEVFSALKNINLSIKSGEYVSLVGSSGSGKSSLANVLGLLISPSSGDYFYNGNLVSKLSERERLQIRGSEIGFIFQDYVLIDYLTVLENVALTLSYESIPRKTALHLATLELNRMGLSQKLNHLPKQLSGGQKQRVAIARALLRRPKLILADEPTGALDLQSRYEVLSILQDLHASGMTILTVTHSDEDATASKRMIRIEEGEIIDDGPQRIHNRFFGKLVTEDSEILQKRVATALEFVQLKYGVRTIEDFISLTEKNLSISEKVNLLNQFKLNWYESQQVQHILNNWFNSEDDYIRCMVFLIFLKLEIRTASMDHFFKTTLSKEACLLFLKSTYEFDIKKFKDIINPEFFINHESPIVRASSVQLFKFPDIWSSSSFEQALTKNLSTTDERVIANTLDFIYQSPLMNESQLRKMSIPYHLSPRATASWCRLLFSWGDTSGAMEILVPMLESLDQKQVTAAVWVMAREKSFNLYKYLEDKLSSRPEFIGHIDSILAAYKRALESSI